MSVSRCGSVEFGYDKQRPTWGYKCGSRKVEIKVGWWGVGVQESGTQPELLNTGSLSSGGSLLFGYCNGTRAVLLFIFNGEHIKDFQNLPWTSIKIYTYLSNVFIHIITLICIGDGWEQTLTQARIRLYPTGDARGAAHLIPPGRYMKAHQKRESPYGFNKRLYSSFLMLFNFSWKGRIYSN